MVLVAEGGSVGMLLHIDKSMVMCEVYYEIEEEVFFRC